MYLAWCCPCTSANVHLSVLGLETGCKGSGWLGGYRFSQPCLFSSPLVQCSLLVKWQLGAERRIRSNIGSSLQLKHHGKNCLALSVTLLCAITDLTILENAGTENLSSVFQFLLLVLSFHKYSRSGNEDWLPRDQSSLTGHGCESRFGPERRRGLICHLVFCQCKILTKIGVGPPKRSGSEGIDASCSTWAAELDRWGWRVGCQEAMSLFFLSLPSLQAKK